MIHYFGQLAMDPTRFRNGAAFQNVLRDYVSGNAQVDSCTASPVQPERERSISLSQTNPDVSSSEIGEANVAVVVKAGKLDGNLTKPTTTTEDYNAAKSESDQQLRAQRSQTQLSNRLEKPTLDYDIDISGHDGDDSAETADYLINPYGSDTIPKLEEPKIPEQLVHHKYQDSSVFGTCDVYTCSCRLCTKCGDPYRVTTLQVSTASLLSSKAHNCLMHAFNIVSFF
jgi:hypothetical protein